MPQTETVNANQRSFRLFQQLGENDKFVGGKAFVLSQLAQMNLPVPAGSVLTALPNDDEWQGILAWWSENGRKPLAVRSSGRGEDSEEFSYAGQQQTFLNVQSESELREAVEKCFHS